MTLPTWSQSVLARIVHEPSTATLEMAGPAGVLARPSLESRKPGPLGHTCPGLRGSKLNSFFAGKDDELLLSTGTLEYQKLQITMTKIRNLEPVSVIEYWKTPIRLEFELLWVPSVTSLFTVLCQQNVNTAGWVDSC